MATEHLTAEQAGRRFMELEGSTMDFVCSRSDEKVAEQAGTSFSQEAIENLTMQMHLWLGSRLWRDITAVEGRTHQKLKVTVTIEVDGRVEGKVPVEAELVDGSIRLRVVGDDER